MTLRFADLNNILLLTVEHWREDISGTPFHHSYMVFLCSNDWFVVTEKYPRGISIYAYRDNKDATKQGFYN